MASIEKHGPDQYLVYVKAHYFGGDTYAEEMPRVRALALMASMVDTLKPTQAEIEALTKAVAPNAAPGYAPALAALLTKAHPLAEGLAHMAYRANSDVVEFVDDATERAQDVLDELRDGLEFCREHG